MVIDNFNRAGRWDSVGMGCYTCQYLQAPPKWPDEKKEIACNFHNVSLSIELREAGYIEGEWFCKAFKDNGQSLKEAVKHFSEIKSSLNDGILYAFDQKDPDLREVPFEQLRPKSGDGESA